MNERTHLHKLAPQGNLHKKLSQSVPEILITNILIGKLNSKSNSFFFLLQMHHTMDGLDMLDPSGSMTGLAQMSDTPITSSHHQLHGSYHSMNHMMGHHHGGPLAGHTPGKNQILY